MSTSTDELTRIRTAYAKRPATRCPTAFYDAAVVFLTQEAERAFMSLLRQNNLVPLETRKILDVGTGEAFFLRALLKYGARQSNLFGVDFWHDLVCDGHAVLPSLGLVCGDARYLPFADNTFDIVTQQTMFSSVIDSNARARIAREMLRVVKPQGRIFSYDFRFKRPGDHDVCRIGAREMRRLFPGTKITFNTVGLLPQLARFLAPRSQLLCDLIGALWPVGTHYWTTIDKSYREQACTHANAQEVNITAA
jgi:ubiquinone/menaquinone biosynthesis C-methylase UbiE